MVATFIVNLTTFMKNKLLLFATLLSSVLFGQDTISRKKIDVDYNIGQGLNIDIDENKFHFKLHGLINPYFENKVDLTFNQTQNYNLLHFGAVRLMMEGGALHNKFVYKVDFNLVDERPLLAAWFGYNAFKSDSKHSLLISAGQKRTSTNSREGYFNEPNAALQDRSLLSSQFANTGREIGLFVESNFVIANFLGIRPSLALTSGDGRYIFNSGSSNADVGGLKYGGRLDITFGQFKEGNYYSGIDLAHEDKPTFAIGAAYSINQGASDAKGDDHRTMLLYQASGQLAYADYSKFYADFLFKWKGITLMGEYALTDVTNDDDVLEAVPGAIPSYQAYDKYRSYILGSAMNVTLGYAFNKLRMTIDSRYTQTTAAQQVTSSLLPTAQQYTLGVAKYFLDNDALKFQVVGNYTVENQPSSLNDTKYFTTQLIVQMLF